MSASLHSLEAALDTIPDAGMRDEAKRILYGNPVECVCRC